MNPILKEHLISASQTFLAGFLTALIPVIEGTVEWTTAFWISVALACIRAGVKELIAKYAPVSLGGRK